MMMKHLTIIFLALSVLGCANAINPNTKEFIPISAIPTGATEGRIVSPDKIYLELGVIPGALYGAPYNEPSWYIDLYPENQPEIDVTVLSKALKKYASKMTGNPINNGLVLEPNQTKFVRVSTFGSAPNEFIRFSGGLEDEYGNFLVLAYFDRKCTLRGTKDFGEEGIYHHNLVIDGPGLYKLIATYSDGAYTLTAEKNNKLIYAVVE
ncbi:hypothetical protein [Teredinibacter haidensis]|uniref:hypothetical protein n=1 Tax=Teredinibacter haidensis TaxID=2731755 RepID=UPI001115144E|nr:hypothetical protein [Teredinibacter haidensis]